MNIDFSLVRELTNDLEMNGRKFIIRDREIQKLKAEGTYSSTHNQDLIYFHIISDMINAIIEKIMMYLEYKDSLALENVYRDMVQSAYKDYKEYYSHSEFLKEMTVKYG